MFIKNYDDFKGFENTLKYNHMDELVCFFLTKEVLSFMREILENIKRKKVHIEPSILR